MTERIFHYIPIPRIDDWLRLGWLIVGELPGPHSQYCMLGEWLCDCPIVKPAKAKR